MTLPVPPAGDPTQGPDLLAESGRYSFREELPLDRIFTPREVRLMTRLQEWCRPESRGVAAELRRALGTGLKGLASIALSLAAYPSLRVKASLGGKERSGETLLDRLMAAGEHGLEWTLPTKAILSRTYGIAKVNFWTAAQYALEPDPSPEARELLALVKEAIEEAVYSRLAEELYGSFVTSRWTSPEVKRATAEQVLELWDGRVGFATDRFCPILRSAWAARCRAPRVFGTLMGTTEIFSLILQDCDARFVEWFSRQRYDSEQVQAFEEFLFDLPFESLEKVRAMMREEGRSAVGPDEVARYLGFPKGRLRPLIEDPKQLYVSFRKRRVKAQYRTSMRVAGPKRTAESYLLEALLAQGPTG